MDFKRIKLENKNIITDIKCSDELALLIKQNECVIIKISASWCGPCKNKIFIKNYHDIVESYKNIDNIKFVELDADIHVDILNNQEKFGFTVDSVPTFIIKFKNDITHIFTGINCLNDIIKILNNNKCKFN